MSTIASALIVRPQGSFLSGTHRNVLARLFAASSLDCLKAFLRSFSTRCCYCQEEELAATFCIELIEAELLSREEVASE